MPEPAEALDRACAGQRFGLKRNELDVVARDIVGRVTADQGFPVHAHHAGEGLVDLDHAMRRIHDDDAVAGKLEEAAVVRGRHAGGGCGLSP